ncbi:hypothetical protein RA27_10745 [Ruegeria sp. ANG-R]|uniref:hypothetical protein n=1 Tax=Ruegeria sp. ANG-R TaxID=1577903 RepID=UPI00057E88B1|nr:hypothetical protein [Ruegeria sp. ANG-R]KIC41109.1 hypothetical protein RA27_10745 [Ruegeria sp. ANG-R]
MSRIDHVEFECSRITYAKLFEGSREHEEELTGHLQERLAPERLCKFDLDNGWMLTAFNSPTRYERDQASI